MDNKLDMTSGTAVQDYTSSELRKYGRRRYENRDQLYLREKDKRRERIDTM
jgi:hypothetical protein